jgi:short-subunit dehydrogenase
VFGTLDVMICNAGFGYYGTVEQTTAPTMARMMDVNFMGTFLGARAALPVFRARGSGHLIIVSSIVGQRGIPLMSGYSATKAAQVGFAESLRSEFTGTAIRVSVVFPISTETEFRFAMERDFGHSVSGVGPKQTVDDVARAVVACVRRPRPEVYPHAASRVLAIANAVAPGVTDRLVRRYGRRREHA